MRLISLVTFVALISSLLFLSTCSQDTPKKELAPVHSDPQFNALFSPDSGGITGADGIFSIPLPNGSSVFLTGDCFLGEVINNSRDAGTFMLNNSMVVVNREGTEATAVYRGTYESPESLFVPEQNDGLKHWYWPGHGFVADSILYVFALNMYNDPSLLVASDKDREDLDEVDKLAENQWAFAVAGIDLLRFSLPDLHFIDSDPVEYTYELDIHFGNCVFVDGNYIYFFGTRNDPDGSHIYVARTLKGKLPYQKNWEFYAGEGWTSDHRQAAPMKLDISVSEQFSIFRIRDKYVLLTHAKSTPDIVSYTSDLPYRAYKNKTHIYRSPEPEADSTGQLFAYNALAHPQYIQKDMLLVSYCVNSHRVRDVFEDVDNYRARFIRVPLAMIDSSFYNYQPDFKLALVQMKVEGGKRAANLAKAREMIQKAAVQGADIVLLPEAMDLGWAHPSALKEATSIPDGETCQMLKMSAIDNQIYICSGLVEKAGDEVFNSALVLSPTGEILMHHRKINVLDIAQDYYGQGRGLEVIETRFGSIGLMICADGFAEQRVISQSLCYMGADLILSPTAWALPPELSHDQQLATDIWYSHYSPLARKYEIFIAGCSNVGLLSDGPWGGYSAIGNSMVIGPEGTILAKGDFGVDAEMILYCDLIIRNRPVRGTDWIEYF